MVQQPEAAAARQLMAAVPEGWLWLGRARPGTEPGGCHILAHPEHGLALVDVAPEATPRAEARLRAALQAGGFAYAFSGMLPVVHVRVEPSGLSLVTPLVQGGLAAQPGIGITRPGWPQALANVLANRPDWSDAEPEAAAPRGGWYRAARWGVAGLALAATFVGGLLLGANTVAVPLAPTMPTAVSASPASGPPPASPQATPPESPPVLSPLPGMQAAIAPPVGLPVGGALAVGAPGVGTLAPALPGEFGAAVPAAPLPMEPAAAEAPAEPLAGEVAVAEPPPARPRTASARRNLEIDPGCAEAVLRYQQGLSLSWSEMAHVRNGCRSVVRR